MACFVWNYNVVSSLLHPVHQTAAHTGYRQELNKYTLNTPEAASQGGGINWDII